MRSLLRNIQRCSLLIIIVFALLFSQRGFSQDDPGHGGAGIYFGFGTSVSSYLGGYFGQAYQMRVLTSSYDDYYNYYNTYSYSSYYYYDDYTIWSPIQFDLTGGIWLSDFLALESEASFLFHLNGRVDPQFKSGSIGEQDYLDRNDYATLYAVPVSVCLKLMMRGDDDGYAAFIKGGPAFQYTDEQYDKIREFYGYSGYYEYSNDVYLGTVAKSEWLSGFRVVLGMQYGLGEFMGGYTELEYSYFNINPNHQTALALDQAPEAQLFSLKTVLYFQF
jgi:hypothetical protein